MIISNLYISVKYPIAYESLIAKYSNEYNVDPFLVASIINVESKYDKNAISKKDARGLMQIGPQTGSWAGEVLQIEDYSEDILFDPETNIRIGVWYLSLLEKEFDCRDLVLAAYNAGSGNVRKWMDNNECSLEDGNLKDIPFKETSDYLDRVKSTYKIYSSIYENKLTNPSGGNAFYINFLHIIKKSLKLVLKM